MRPQADGPFVDAGILVVQHARFGDEAGVDGDAVAGGGHNGEAVWLSRRNRQKDGDGIASGRKEVGDGAGLWQRVALRHIENQAVGVEPACVEEGNGAIVERVGIQFQARQTVMRREP